MLKTKYKFQNINFKFIINIYISFILIIFYQYYYNYLTIIDVKIDTIYLYNMCHEPILSLIIFDIPKRHQNIFKQF